MDRKLLIIMTLLILITSGCSGGTGGSVSGTRQSCQSVGGLISCEGGINKLNGTFSHSVAASYYRKGESVVVEALFAVESGSMAVSIDAPDGTQTRAEVEPGNPAVLKGLGTVESSLDENTVPFKLQALNGTVEGITFQILISQP